MKFRGKKSQLIFKDTIQNACEGIGQLSVDCKIYYTWSYAFMRFWQLCTHVRVSIPDDLYERNSHQAYSVFTMYKLISC